MKRKIKRSKFFTLIGSKDHNQSDRTGSVRAYKSAFTLIELIVVMAVIGILVLLAAPKFLGYTERAQETKHIHTAKVIETALEAYLIHGGVFPEDLEVVDEAVLNEAVNNESLYGVDGLIGSPDGETYYELTHEFIQKLDVKLSAKHELLLEALASAVPTAVYASEKGIAMVDKEKVLKGYLETKPLPEPSPTPSIPEDDYTQEEIDELITQGYIAISTPQDLDNVRKNLSGKYVQINDIDLSEFANFEPIGNAAGKFKGIYDGGRFEITNLTINDFETSKYGIGLFGQVESGAIKNVQLVNANIYGFGSVGSIAGYLSSSSLSNSYSINVNVSGYATVGGLVGENSKSSVTNSYCEGSVSASEYYVGGLVGNLAGVSYSASTVLNSYFVGEVSGKQDVGGLFGIVQNTTTITNCISSAVINGETYIGGAVGRFFNGDKRYITNLNNVYALKIEGIDIFGIKMPNSSSGAMSSMKTSNFSYVTQEGFADEFSFIGFDFINVWEIKPGATHPTLITIE